MDERIIIANNEIGEKIRKRVSYEQLSHPELVKMLLRKEALIEKLRRKVENFTIQRDDYKKQMELCIARNQRQKKDNDYQMKTVALYKKLLCKLVEL
jgi:hypothetical protein